MTKNFKNDTRASPNNFIPNTYRTVGLKSINNHLGKSIAEVQTDWDKVVRPIDKLNHPVGTKFVIAISKKTGKYAIQKVLIPINSGKAADMRMKKRLSKKSTDNPNKKYLDGKRQSQQPHEIAYRKSKKD